MRSVAAFVRLSRLFFLGGGAAAFAVGAAVAAFEGYRITAGTYALGQALVTAFQLMVHYANDYFDRAGDAAAVRTRFSGGSGVLTAGLLPPRVALRAAAACACAGIAAAAAFAAKGNVPAAVTGIAVGAFAWAYSAPPFRLLATGWGEADTALVVGALVPLLGAAAFAGRIDALAVAACAPAACAMFAMMLAVEWPDVAADAACGKRNLVVRFGRAAAARFAALAIVAAVAGVAATALPAAAGGNLCYALLPAIAGGRLWTGFRRPPDAAAEVAARGVAFFALTAVCTAAAFARPMR